MMSTKNEQFFDPYLQKWTIDLLFKNKRARKHTTNTNTSSPPFKKERDGEIRDFKD